MAFFPLTKASISCQYSSAFPMPINLKNFILSYFDFLFTVISFSIFRVDSLNLKGSTLAILFYSYRERDLDDDDDDDDYSFFLSNSFFLPCVFVWWAFDGGIEFYLTVKVRYP